MLRLFAICFFVLISSFSQAQQRLEPGQMHYIINPKPNNIFYRDTLYQGSKQFMQLFYRTRDQQLIDLYLKHQSNKVAGQILGVAGSFAMIFGIRNLSEENKKGTSIFFSSHILAEIQRLCNRAAIIRKGEISAVEDIQSLLEKQMKKARFIFTAQKELEFIEGVQNPVWTNNKLTFDYMGPVKDLIKWMNELDLKDAVLEEPDLETIFMNYYQ